MADGSSWFTLPAAQQQGLHPRLGRVVGLDGQGRPLVTFAGAPARAASTLGPVPRAELEAAALEQRVVLLAFLDGRADAPVLLSLHGPSEPEPERAPEPAEARQLIEAPRELVLRCGKASITLRSDGTVLIRGRDVTSWARRRQRIRGGSVNIN